MNNELLLSCYLWIQNWIVVNLLLQSECMNGAVPLSENLSQSFIYSSGDQFILFVQKHSSQHVCMTLQQNTQSTVRKEWRGWRFGVLWLVYDEALQEIVFNDY